MNQIIPLILIIIIFVIIQIQNNRDEKKLRRHGRGIKHKTHYQN